MGRPRKHLHEIEEKSLKHNASRYKDRKPAPQTDGSLGEPPSWMRNDQKTAWKEIEQQAPSLLGSSDRSFVEIAAVLRAKLSAGTISSGETSVLVATLKQLGFGTVDRKSREDVNAKSILEVLREEK